MQIEVANKQEVQHMNIVDKYLSELIRYKNNPRHNENAVDAVAKSIKEFGFKVAIVIDKNNVIVCGDTRYLAAQKLGLETVPCIVADDLTEEQIKAFRLADNKVGEIAEWDFEKLEAELKNIQNIDMTDFDFEFDYNIDDIEEDNFDVDEALEEIEKPITQYGDMYRLGNHILLCGDSTQKEDVLRLMNGEQADLLLTDPPYNVDYEGTAGKIQNDSMEDSKFKEFLLDTFNNAYSVLNDGASFYVCYASREVVNFQSSIIKSGLSVKQELIWNKNSLVMGRQDYQWKHEPILYGWKETASHNWYGDRTQTTIIDWDRPTKSEFHPTMKPVGLFSYLIQNSSKKDDIVLDLFGGSGTTLIACEQLDRSCRMVEYVPKYCDVIIRRYKELTGKEAEKIV